MGSVQEGSFSLGPWGGIGGNRWSFFASRGIRAVKIKEGYINNVNEEGRDRDSMIIKSISFKDTDGFEYGPFGKKDPDPSDRYKTIYFSKKKKEYLKYIAGTFGSVAGMMGMAITSISVITNEKKHGPFGTVSGTPFSSLMDKTLIVGFFGRSSNQCVEALGVYLLPRYIEENISVGPWGHTGGKEYWSFKSSHGISKIVIHHRNTIKAISLGDAESENLTKFGNNDPDDNEKLIEIDPSSEYLTSITGTFDQLRITSLGFVTNKNTYSPLGNASGITFSIPIKDSVIAGFHGRGDNYLQALGYFVKPKSPERKISMGPWGNYKGGTRWDFIPSHGINEVIIRYEGAVFAVAFRDADGSHSGIFGDGSGSPDEIGTRKEIDIDWPSEYLTSISGSYGIYKDNLVVTSLSFKTNWNSYGPFGTVQGTTFSSHTDKCVIVGFYGSAGYFLDSIGFYARPFNT